MMLPSDIEPMIATGMWQRNRGRKRPRFRKASRSRASDSPAPGECGSTNGPARRRIMEKALTREDDRELFGLNGAT